MLSTFTPSKTSEPAKSISLSTYKLPVEKTEMSISDMTPGHLRRTPEGHRGVHIRQRTHEHQNHGGVMMLKFPVGEAKMTA